MVFQKISIITVCKNSEDTIEDTIKSVIFQGYPNLEFIIIDGGSTDNTLKIINKYRHKITTIVSEVDEGEYYAMNKGLVMSSGEIVGFLCADDTFACDSVIERIANEYENNDIDVLWGDVLIVNRMDQSKIIRYYSGGGFNKNKFKFGLMPPHPGIFIKRKLLLDCKGFDIDFKVSADYDLISRILNKNDIKYRYIPKIIVYMKSGGVTNSSFKNKLLLNYEIYKSNFKNNVTANPLLLLFKIPYRFIELIKKPE